MESSNESHDDGRSTSAAISAHFTLCHSQADKLDLESNIGRYVVYAPDGRSRFGSRFPQRLPRPRQRIHVHRIDSKHSLPIQSKSTLDEIWRLIQFSSFRPASDGKSDGPMPDHLWKWVATCKEGARCLAVADRLS